MLTREKMLQTFLKHLHKNRDRVSICRKGSLIKQRTLVNIYRANLFQNIGEQHYIT